MQNSHKQKRISLSPTKDCKLLHYIHNLCLPDELWSSEAVEGYIKNDHNTALIARDGNTDVGFVFYRKTSDEVELISIGVAPLERRNGYGIALMEHVVSENKGCKFFLEVAEDNANAIKMYKNSGFQITGRREKYYYRNEGEKIDALLMSRT